MVLQGFFKKNKQIKAVMVSISGLKLTAWEKKLLSTHNPLGVILFNRNIDNEKQLKKLITEIKKSIGRKDVLVAVDQEGGRVCRIENMGGYPRYSSQQAIGGLPFNKAIEMARLHGFLIGTQLRELGFNMNFAPCLDIRFNNTSPVLSCRCLSEDPLVVASLGQEMIHSFMETGICPCMKHLPGHGRAIADPHLETAVIKKTLTELKSVDFMPFASVSQTVPAGMTAHIIIPEVDNKPITQSSAGIEKIIRKQIGFDGFLFSDAIDMHALKGTLAEKVTMGLQAGCDAVCYCMGEEKGLEEVLTAASYLTEKALIRLKKIQAVIQHKPKIKNIEFQKQKYVELQHQTTEPSTDYDAVETLHKMQQKG